MHSPTEKSSLGNGLPEHKDPTCVHHWIIESMPGESSPGICRHCGKQKRFPNYVDEFVWKDRSEPVSSSLRGILSSIEVTRDDIDHTSWENTVRPAGWRTDLHNPSDIIEEDLETRG